MKTDAESERRLSFGENCQNCPPDLAEERSHAPERTLLTTCEMANLTDKTFLYVGAEGGMASLVTRREVAKVPSFDCDHNSIAYAAELKRLCFLSGGLWTIDLAGC